MTTRFYKTEMTSTEGHHWKQLFERLYLALYYGPTEGSMPIGTLAEARAAVEWEEEQARAFAEGEEETEG